MRVVIANFDAELEMARAACPGPHPRLPSHVRRHLDQASKQLEVFAGDAAIASSVEQARDLAPRPSAILAWAETNAISEFRHEVQGTSLPSAARATRAWIDALWKLRSDPSATRACHDRRFWLGFAEQRDGLLPQTHVIESLTQLRRLLPAVVAHSAGNAWIAKAPFGAAGRERVYRWGVEFPHDIATRLERLIDRYGQLILEPNMTRECDFGVSGVVDEAGARCFAPHRLHCDEAGVYRRIELSQPDGSSLEVASICEASEAAGAALHERGHRGAFGIDGFFYRSTSGALALHPCCEINARLTFGHVAHACAASDLP